MGEVATGANPLNLIRDRRDVIASVWHEGYGDFDRFLSVAIMNINQDKNLRECLNSRDGVISLVVALQKMASLGLYPDKNLGYGYIIAYKGIANFQLGYKGVIKLAYRSKAIKHIEAIPVYACDKFQVIEGERRQIIHEPNLFERKGLEPWLYYARAINTADSSVAMEYMTVDEIREIEKKTRRGQQMSAPWRDWFGEMAKKTVILRLLKYYDLSMDINEAIEREFGSNPPEAKEIIVGAHEVSPSDDIDSDTIDTEVHVDKMEELPSGELL